MGYSKENLFCQIYCINNYCASEQVNATFLPRISTSDGTAPIHQCLVSLRALGVGKKEERLSA